MHELITARMSCFMFPSILIGIGVRQTPSHLLIGSLCYLDQYMHQITGVSTHTQWHLSAVSTKHSYFSSQGSIFPWLQPPSFSNRPCLFSHLCLCGSDLDFTWFVITYVLNIHSHLFHIHLPNIHIFYCSSSNTSIYSYFMSAHNPSHSHLQMEGSAAGRRGSSCLE